LAARRAKGAAMTAVWYCLQRRGYGEGGGRSGEVVVVGVAEVGVGLVRRTHRDREST
jgi:hypothetical protein